MKLLHVTPNTSVAMVLVLVLICAAVAPQLVYRAAADGGFEQSGQKINLGRWTHMTAQSHGGSLPKINRPNGSSPAHDGSSPAYYES